MLASEPAQTRYDWNFRLFGTPVRVHPWFWFAMLILGSGDPRPAAVLIFAGAAFLSILVHEFGHVLAMRRYGTTSRVVLHGFGGLTIPNSERRRTPTEQVIISLAGPFAGFVLFGVVFLGMWALGHPVRWDMTKGFDPFNLRFVPFFAESGGGAVNYLLLDLLLINLSWGLLNLMPVIPLDGGRVAQAILVARNARQGAQQMLILSIATAGVLAILAWTQWGQPYLALLFAYLAFVNYQAWQQLTGRTNSDLW